MKRKPASRDDLRYGTAGDEFADALQAEVRADYAALMLVRRNAPQRPAEDGDRLCGCGAVLRSKRSRCYACARYESRNGHPRPIGSAG